jgi:Protein of unknown function (DUF1236)
MTQGESEMKREIIIGTTALSIFVGSQAFAQTAVLQISPEQRVIIREYVVREKVKPIVIKDVTVGAALPSDVELIAVPSDWGPSFVSYRYVYSGNRVVLVEPSSRRVIQIID